MLPLDVRDHACAGFTVCGPRDRSESKELSLPQSTCRATSLLKTPFRVMLTARIHWRSAPVTLPAAGLAPETRLSPARGPGQCQGHVAQSRGPRTVPAVPAAGRGRSGPSPQARALPIFLGGGRSEARGRALGQPQWKRTGCCGHFITDCRYMWKVEGGLNENRAPKQHNRWLL